ncbi:hypothetical protein P278_01970 [Zhouia amylolytica AD3]|uniref:Uncharacterized protein n=1 Tax=Zhouia amylolytica AD3 TaxID=1286632 RepID=W2UTY2_9FLAO|nr:hypothetical protein P278_01970 [Zhouia amylolytica AD3]
MPKKDSKYFPVKKDIMRMIKVLIAVQSAVLESADLDSSCVNPTKIGTVPSGFMTENKAAKMYRNNSMFFAQN